MPDLWQYSNRVFSVMYGLVLFSKLFKLGAQTMRVGVTCCLVSIYDVYDRNHNPNLSPNSNLKHNPDHHTDIYVSLCELQKKKFGCEYVFLSRSLHSAVLLASPNAKLVCVSRMCALFYA